MLHFKKLDDATSCELCSYYKNSPYLLSDYSIGLKKMWKDVLNPEFAVSSGCVVTKNTVNNETTFDFPLPVSDEHCIASALEDISKYCRDNYIKLKLSNVPEAHISDVTSLFPHCDITYDRKYSDYIYHTAKLAEMSGRSYSAQRNHIKKFHLQYPDAVFKVFNKDDIPSVKKFLDRFRSIFAKTAGSALEEMRYSESMIDRIGSSCFRSGGFVLDNEIISLCFCEKCGDTLIDHIEKALYEFEGIYPATVQAFLQTFGSDTKYFNREDDSGDRGLRISKLQYKPYKVAHKYFITLNTELSKIVDHPTIVSERLTYSKISEVDIPQYNILCLDDESNKYWGYDYRTACEKPSYEYFYQDQKSDFENRVNMSFAIRHDNEFIVEVILHNFDCKGTCEIGIRLLNNHKGMGYGREALNTIIRYALYELGLDAVYARCYKENRVSSNMLSTVMRLDNKDENYLYYIATF
jgi:RimJ/RimL family protein N-acetyltransferase